MPSLLPTTKLYFTTSAGLPLVGGKLFTYDTGTTTPRVTYQDAAGTIPNTNPVILDARGEALVFWSGSYRVVLKDALDNTIWTVDSVTEVVNSYKTSNTGSIITPIGTTAQRDVAPAFGYLRHNSDLSGLEVFGPNGWQPVGQTSNTVGGAEVRINTSAVAQPGNVSYRNNGTAAANLRWLTGKTSTAEAGVNAGSDWAIYRYADDGSYLGNPLTISRATGVISFAAAPDGAGITALFASPPPIGTSTPLVPVVASLNGGQLAGMRNKIINGKMEITQRGTSFGSITDGIYTLDRWQAIFTSSTGSVTIATASDNPTNEFSQVLRATVNTADVSIAAGENCGIAQAVEGYNTRDLVGKTFTLSFWVRSSKTGIHCVSFRNGSFDRSYVAQYTINTANTWEYKTITVTNGLTTGGTWNTTINMGVRVTWAMMAGSTWQTTAGAWQTGNFLATANQVNCLDTIGNIFSITGVQLETGSVATPFEHRSFGVEFALCQRYFETSYDPSTIPGSAWGANSGIGSGMGCPTNNHRQFTPFRVSKRSAPSIVTYDQAGTAARYSYFISSWSNGGTVFGVTPQSTVGGFYWGASLASIVEVQAAWTASSEL